MACDIPKPSSSPRRLTVSTENGFEEYLDSFKPPNTQRITKKDIEPFQHYLAEMISTETAWIRFSHQLPTAFIEHPKVIIFSSETPTFTPIPPRVQCITHITPFCEKLAKNTTLLELHFVRVGFNGLYTPPLAQALAINTHLRTLILRGNPLGCPDELAVALAANQHLEELDLSDTLMGSECLRRLAKAITRNSSLRVLNISKNVAIDSCDDQAMESFAAALRINSYLTILIFTESDISNWGASRLFEALTSNRSLKVLDLGSNKIKTLFEHKLLTPIPSGARTVLKYEGIIGVNSFAELLEINSSLEKIDLSANDIDDDGVFALTYALSQRKNQSPLTRLDLRNNPKISLQGIKELVASSMFMPSLNVNVSLVAGKIDLALCHANCLPIPQQSSSQLTLKEHCWNQLKASGITPFIETAIS